jgi:ABC-2 type transport system permease protein
MSGVDLVQAAFRGWLPPVLLDAIAGFSFLTNFDVIAKGLVDIRTIVFFVSLICLGLIVNTAILALKREG